MTKEKLTSFSDDIEEFSKFAFGICGKLDKIADKAGQKEGGDAYIHAYKVMHFHTLVALVQMSTSGNIPPKVKKAYETDFKLYKKSLKDFMKEHPLVSTKSQSRRSPSTRKTCKS